MGTTMIMYAIMIMVLVFVGVLLVNRHIQGKHNKFKANARIAEDPQALMAQLKQKKIEKQKKSKDYVDPDLLDPTVKPEDMK